MAGHDPVCWCAGPIGVFCLGLWGKYAPETNALNVSMAFATTCDYVLVGLRVYHKLGSGLLCKILVEPSSELGRLAHNGWQWDLDAQARVMHSRDSKTLGFRVVIFEALRLKRKRQTGLGPY